MKLTKSGKRDKRYRNLGSRREIEADHVRLKSGLRPIVQDKMLYGYLSSLMSHNLLIRYASHTMVTLTFRNLLGIPDYKPGMTIVEHAVRDFKSNLYRNFPTNIVVIVEERGDNSDRYHLHAVVQWRQTPTMNFRGFKYPLDLVEALNKHELKYGFVYPSKVSRNNAKNNSNMLSYVLKYVLKEGGRNWL